MGVEGKDRVSVLIHKALLVVADSVAELSLLVHVFRMLNVSRLQDMGGVAPAPYRPLSNHDRSLPLLCVAQRNHEECPR